MANSGPSCTLGILLVDDEPDLYLAGAEVLRDAGHEVHTAVDGEQALEVMSSRHVDVMLTDIRLPGLDALSLLRLARQRSPATIVILVTAPADVDQAIAAVGDGAHDTVTKPLRSDDIARRIERIAAQVSIQRQRAHARTQLARRATTQQIVGCSTIMSRMMDRLRTIAASDAPVLLFGETGTGKELVARSLHAWSPRHGRPFAAVSCASFPDSFQAAHGGTLLLDEVGDMSSAAQDKLLRVLDDHSVDVRVISATHRDLAAMTDDGEFREDLYHRLNVLSIDVPPLRARQGDLALLAQYFLNKFRRPGDGAARMSSAAWSALSVFGFPGNVRQLGQALAHATVLAGGGEIDLRHLPAEIRARPGGCEIAAPSARRREVANKELELEYVRQVLWEARRDDGDAA
jgi:DNA-binding NtrC family response regulator